MDLTLRCPQGQDWGPSQQLTEHRCLSLFLSPLSPYLLMTVCVSHSRSRSRCLSTRMWCIVAVGGSRGSSTVPGICAVSNYSPWCLYQGRDHHPSKWCCPCLCVNMSWMVCHVVCVCQWYRDFQSSDTQASGSAGWGGWFAPRRAWSLWQDQSQGPTFSVGPPSCTAWWEICTGCWVSFTLSFFNYHIYWFVIYLWIIVCSSYNILAAE